MLHKSDDSCSIYGSLISITCLGRLGPVSSKVFLGVYALFLCVCSGAVAETAQSSWTDANFAFCEGIGVGASGRVNAHAEYNDDGSVVMLSSFSVTTTGHSFDHIASGRINYIDDASQQREVRLEQPWFPVMGAAGPGDVLYLPRNKTSTATSGPWEQMSIKMQSGSTIKIILNLLFSADGGNCPTSFSADWTLP